jgi:diacylglycerol kinase/membrane-associated phospholipid phosphatase
MRLRGKWALVVLLLALFALLGLGISVIHPVDSAISVSIAALRSTPLTGLFTVFTFLASPLALLLGSLVLILLVREQKYWTPILANLAISVFLNLGLKDVFLRVRPTEVTQLVRVTSFSFPSGHTMAAMSFYGFVIYLLWRSDRLARFKRPLAVMLGTLIALIGFSRVYLGVHYASVLAGYAIGAAYLIIFTSFVSAYFHEERALADLLPGSIHYRFAYSLAHAMDGIIGGLKAERNMIIHFGAMVLVTIFALLLGCTPLEWCILFIFFALVITAELFNTAMEATIDLVTQEFHPKAKLAKDTAAGAVLACSLFAAIAGAIIFIPKLLKLLR